MPLNRRFTLARRPHGVLVPEDFKLVEEPTAPLQDGEFLLKNLGAVPDLT